MTDEIDITPEAVRIMHKRLGSTPFPGDLQSIVNDADLMIEALFQRCGELALERDAAHNDALRDAAGIAKAKHDAAMKWAKTYLKNYDGKTDSLLIHDEIIARIEGEKP